MPGVTAWRNCRRNCLPLLDERVRLEGVLVRHDAQELLLVHLAVAVHVCLVDHLLQLLVRHVLAQLPRNALEVFERDFASLVVVKELEDAHDLLRGVAVAHLARHHFDELFEVDGAAAVQVDVLDHLAHLLLLRVEAESAQSHAELLCVDCARAIRVEEVKRLLQFLHLPFGDARPRANATARARLLARDRRRLSVRLRHVGFGSV
mmetsp:Transcript_22058/g.55923  ORF Transcript_22058/g.55923 Transcript_22058/m.55923 type:complete len:206 (-) Transcript_22058:12-629(-)